SITCPGNLTAVCAISEQPAYTTFAEFTTAGGSASDNCGIDESSFAHVGDVSDGGSCPETITRTYQIADLCGNVQTCEQLIVIDDEELPSITCPGNLTAVCAISEQPAYTTFAEFTTAGGSASDNCGIDESSFTHVGDVSNGSTCPETITRTYQIADLCGNLQTCTQLIVIDDEELPSITCPGNLTAVCDINEQPAYADYTAFVNAGGSATDNCGIDESSFTHIGDVSDGGSCPETITRTYQIADLCGNIQTCEQLIVIDDEELPSITCPGNLTAVCDINEQPAYADYTAFVNAGGSATDNCGIDESSFTHIGDVSDGGSCPETITRTYQIADLCGNVQTCEQLIVIDDEELPSITCPGNLTAVCAISEQPVYADYTTFVNAGGSASDNCGIDESSFTHVGDVSDGGSCPETITRTYQIADLCGNVQTCEQLIVIDDEELPSITCPGNLTAVCDINEQPAYADYTAFVNAAGSATDNCGIDESSFAHVGDVSDGGSCPETITRTYQIADLCGNVQTCEQLIVIDDEELPSITCPGNLTAVCAISEQPAYTTFAEFTTAGGSASDNCGIDESSFTHIGDVSDGGSCPETITRTYQIADLCGNVQTCEQQIVIDDEELPSITCPGNLTAVCAISEQPAYTTFAEFTTAGGSASDNCGIDESSFTHIGDVSDNASCPETITRTYQIADLCGNVQTCEQQIVIDDEELPSITCPGNINDIACDVSGLEALSGFAFSATSQIIDVSSFIALGGTASDNCGIQSLTYQDSQSGPCPIVVTRTFTVVDLCDNQSSCVQTITLNADPIVITCPTDPNIPACTSQEDILTAYNAWLAGFTFSGGCSPTDNIDEVPELPADAYDNGADLSFTYSVTDLCSTETCTSTFTVEPDLIPPTFTATPYQNCVDPLHWAIYDEVNPIPVYNHTEPNLQKSPVDYRTMQAGDTFLDLTDLADNCCAAEELTIHWRIDFDDTPDPITGAAVSHPSISGTGQPSTYGSDIWLWGDGVTFTVVQHTITYWVDDCHGNVSEEVEETITIRPRPRIQKMN
ncbi:hypothetical protein C8N47_11960, partial [Mangrovibacterium marinum]